MTHPEISKKTMTDLSVTQQDYALYLPAISSFYVKQLFKITGPDAAEYRVPEGFELGNAALDFLKSDSYYYYPWGLYSAGHAQLDLNKTNQEEPMVQNRDRSKTLILGDSGGFQVATGVIKMDWANATDPNDPARIQICEKILRWLEHSSDWSMTFDVPSVATIPPLNKRTGLKSFQAALDITVLNLDYFLRNRVPGATKFMNILSGNDEASSDAWYQKVKCFSDPGYVKENYGDASRTLEGYALAGANKSNMYLTLKRILDLKRDGLLEGKGWIHFLGTGKLNWACYLTSMQRVIREHYSPDICLSFDAASPFVNTAYGQTYSHNFFSPKKFGYYMDRAFDNQKLKGSNLPMPFNSPVMNRLVAGDICCMAEGDLDRNGKPKGKDSTSWDTQSYLYYMAHSVYNHVVAVQEANRLADLEKFRANVHYSDWISDKKSKNTNEFSPYVPYSVVYFDSFVRDVLNPECADPYGMLNQYRKFLEEISWGALDTPTGLNSQFFDIAQDNVAAELSEEYINYEDVMDVE
jgi:hypothetical protein